MSKVQWAGASPRRSEAMQEVDDAGRRSLLRCLCLLIDVMAASMFMRSPSQRGRRVNE